MTNGVIGAATRATKAIGAGAATELAYKKTNKEGTSTIANEQNEQ